MTRPRIFDKTPRSLHIYLQPEQYTWLKNYCHTKRISPSKFIRDYLNTITHLLPEHTHQNERS